MKINQYLDVIREKLLSNYNEENNAQVKLNLLI